MNPPAPGDEPRLGGEHRTRVLVVGRGPWGTATADLLEHMPDEAVALVRPVLGQPVVEAVEPEGAPVRLEGDGPLPAVVVITDPDPQDRILDACLTAGVPVVDVHRSIASLDRARPAVEGRGGVLVAASGWAGGVGALAAALGVKALGHDGEPAAQVDVDVLLDAGDSAGEEWWRRFAGLHRSYMAYDRGQRRLVRGLGEPKPVAFAAGRRRARRIASPEQESLVETGLAEGAAVRVAFARRSTDVWLALLVGSGAWRFLPTAWRQRILVAAAGSAAHEVQVTVLRPTSLAAVRVLDPKGRAHLVAANAVTQVARVLDAGRPVPVGETHPEQTDDPERDVALLRALGVSVETRVEVAPAG